MEERTKESMKQLMLKVDNLELKNELVEKKFVATENKMLGYKVLIYFTLSLPYMQKHV